MPQVLGVKPGSVRTQSSRAAVKARTQKAKERKRVREGEE